MDSGRDRCIDNPQQGEIIDSKSKMRDEALIAESDNDMEIVSSLSVGFDLFGNLVVEMDYADGSDSRYDYRLDAIVDKDELVLLSRELESFNKSLPLAISDRFGKGWKLLTPSDIDGVFSDILDFILDCGAHYKLKRDRLDNNQV